MLNTLKVNPKFKKRRGPVVLCILDGVGFGKYKDGDAFLNAYKPFINNMLETLPNTRLKAHGIAVGLPSDEDMGNSEVGHNAMGCGRVFAQGAKLVNEAIATGRMFEGEVWQEVIANCKKNNSALHFLGLFSDGNVHSHIDHLKAMIEKAISEGVKKIRIHTLLDGRDVPETSALLYIEPFENFMTELRTKGCDIQIASGGGRMQITMDRYGANWDMVRKGWDIHIHGKGRGFKSAKEAVETLRKETKAIDQDLPGFVISDAAGNPGGKMADGDSVIFFNFRGDRSLEITAAFEEDKFDKFDRAPRPNVYYAGMMEYDGDLKVPKKYLVNPPSIDRTMGEYLCASGVRILAISETQKYGHVTYFFNGNRTGKFNEKLEDYVEIRSDVIPFEQRPWMKCAEITDHVVDAICSEKYDCIRLNFPNGDMVGHTGVYESTIIAVEALDICVKRISEAVTKAGGVLLITADHGNCDDMYQHDKKGNAVTDKSGHIEAKTSHSLNQVPFIVYDPEYKGDYKTELNQGLGISSVTATTIDFLGFIPPQEYDKSIINIT
ncbi:MAG TPA: 2,3-bisphosphoglycerate-independent phosphoglycerate mutase [Lentisphaeria bacterium]|nr:MAG: phosphoglycerate mutase (2,3-diphosphoglycerate-independent) [Lentisphaerae bacterium GWF2_38_69]HBM17548.1 2,3-bisphosphoglycerate-independent phosphoglycerate mutase [Lentisphaeria bacterium]